MLNLTLMEYEVYLVGRRHVYGTCPPFEAREAGKTEQAVSLMENRRECEHHHMKHRCRAMEQSSWRFSLIDAQPGEA